MPSCSPSGPDFSPQPPAKPVNARRLAFPKIVNPEAPPVRPERHTANSIATMRRHLIVALATTLARCPCCNAPRQTTMPLKFYDAVGLSASKENKGAETNFLFELSFWF